MGAPGERDDWIGAGAGIETVHVVGVQLYLLRLLEGGMFELGLMWSLTLQVGELVGLGLELGQVLLLGL